jgi:hypothetical protein
MCVFAFVQELRKFHLAVRFVVIRLEADFSTEQEHDVFLDRRFGAVNLKGVTMKREAAAGIGFAAVLGGRQGVEAEVRR